MRGVKGRILIVDDDTALSEMLGIVLRGEGFDPVSCGDGEQALDAFRDTKPDLVLLDLMLPGKDGIDVCRQIRAESGVLIVMLTAKSDTIDIVVGLESGRTTTSSSRSSPRSWWPASAPGWRSEDPTPETLQIGDLSIDVAGHSVRRDGQTISLTPLEFDLLVALAPPGILPARCCSSRSGAPARADTRLVNVHVQRLRSKVETDPERPEIVVTVRGVGYKAGPA